MQYRMAFWILIFMAVGCVNARQSPDPILASSRGDSAQTPYPTTIPTVSRNPDPASQNSQVIDSSVAVSAPGVRAFVVTSPVDSIFSKSHSFHLDGNAITATLTVSLPLATDAIDVFRPLGLYGEFERDASLSTSVDLDAQKVTFVGPVDDYLITVGRETPAFSDSLIIPVSTPIESSVISIQSILYPPAPQMTEWSTESIPVEQALGNTDRRLILLIPGHNCEYFPGYRFDPLVGVIKSAFAASADIVVMNRKSGDSPNVCATAAVDLIRRRGQETYIGCYSGGCGIAKLIETKMGSVSPIASIHSIAGANHGSFFANITKMLQLFSRRAGGANELAAYTAVLLQHDVRSNYARLPLSRILTGLGDAYFSDGFLALAEDGTRLTTPTIAFRPPGFSFLSPAINILRPESNQTSLCSSSGYRTIPGLADIPSGSDVMRNCLENFLWGLDEAARRRGLADRKNWYFSAGYIQPSRAQKASDEFLSWSRRRDGLSHILEMSPDEKENLVEGYGASLIPQVVGASSEEKLNDGVLTVYSQIMGRPEGPSLLSVSSTLENVVVNDEALQLRTSSRSAAIPHIYPGISHSDILSHAPALNDVRDDMRSSMTSFDARPTLDWAEEATISALIKTAEAFQDYQGNEQSIVVGPFSALGTQSVLVVVRIVRPRMADYVYECQFFHRGAAWLWKWRRISW